MADLFSTGRIVDLIVAIVIVEALLLSIYRWRTARGVEIVDLLNMLLPGLFLLLALRGALVGAHWIWIAGFLVLSLVTHLADLRRRWRA